MVTGLIVLGIIVVFVISVVAIYNGLVTARNRYKNAYAQIDVQLKRRYDLIPNLVETAKGYLKHERETLEAVIKARNTAFDANELAAKDPGDPGAMKSLAGAESILTASLGKLMMVSEQYPDLKANESMANLTEEMTSTENRIAFARQAFNDMTTTYNNKREVFPSNIFVGMFGFKFAELLESIEAPEERKALKVKF